MFGGTKIIGYSGEHSTEGDGLYCPKCWKCVDETEEIRAAIYHEAEGFYGDCEICGEVIGVASDSDAEAYAGDYEDIDELADEEETEIEFDEEIIDEE